jgi:hypothetical protein
VDLQKTIGELNRLTHRRGLEDRKAADHFLGLRERSIDARQLALFASRTRTPSRVGRRPAVRISTPSRVISSMSLPMSFMSCSLGTWPLFSLTANHRKKSHGSLLCAARGLRSLAV